jgi:hypothetical protein
MGIPSGATHERLTYGIPQVKDEVKSKPALVLPVRKGVDITKNPHQRTHVFCELLSRSSNTLTVVFRQFSSIVTRQQLVAYYWTTIRGPIA